MKLASIRYSGQDRVAILRDNSEVAFVEGFTSMLDLIRSGEDAARFGGVASANSVSGQDLLRRDEQLGQ